MFNPKYRTLITNRCFSEDNVIGLGAQLISILNYIESYLPLHLWYGADVQALGKNAKKYNLQEACLTRIGSTFQFIQYCSGIEQFVWGVFVCIDKNIDLQNPSAIEIETEDTAYRSIDASGILLEIRAFDTTHFAIYTEKLDLITVISKKYNTIIEAHRI